MLRRSVLKPEAEPRLKGLSGRRGSRRIWRIRSRRRIRGDGFRNPTDIGTPADKSHEETVKGFMSSSPRFNESTRGRSSGHAPSLALCSGTTVPSMHRLTGRLVFTGRRGDECVSVSFYCLPCQ
ncbi:hypothetical protein EYF80_061824 [Liparis tanakae]|uniref:Uncharacterized protein n=1 Tax=Liparis tanakae TaxID=230148 RepID=A0A4Z2EGG7_9TELE|nr:hypothetical protein EYF80_061824 [Liparis tanakae]